MHDAQVNRGEGGYAMAALLVAIALMAVFTSMALPVYRHAAQREKEEELIWRGQQYDRALQLYRRKTSAPGAPNLDVLVKQKYLRKKYKDPITGGDFELKPVGPAGMTPVSRTPGGAPATPPEVRQPQRGAGQLIGGVRSKSKAKSIRLLNGRDRYDQWEFVYVPYTSTPKVPGTTTPSGRQGQQPGQRGNSPGRGSRSGGGSATPR